MHWFSEATHPPRNWTPGQQLLAAGFGLNVAGIENTSGRQRR
jgi:hypothetical protein